MAVVALFMSDRDPETLFKTKKEADEWDKTLELADGLREMLEQNISDLDEQQAEEIGLLLAKNKQALSKAIKGDVAALSDDEIVPASSKPVETSPGNVVPMQQEG